MIPNRRAGPLVLVLVIFVVKTFLIGSHFKKMEWIAWIAGSTWVLWAGWAFLKDKDLPVSIGDFKYHKGSNNFSRVAYMVMIVGIYLIVAIVS